MSTRRTLLSGSHVNAGAAATLAAVIATAAGLAALGTGQSFTYLESPYQQELYGATQLPEDGDGFAFVLGGVAFAPDGDPWVSECVFGGTRLHRFDAQDSIALRNGTTTMHPEDVVETQGGCGLTNHPDGFMYSNSMFGIYRLDAATGLGAAWPDGGANPRGAAGNALGITVDVRTGHVIYAGADCHPSLVPSATTCTIYDLNPADGTVTNFALLSHAAVPFVDGIYFDPTSTYLFMANRGETASAHFLTILRRPEDSVPTTGSPQFVQSVPMPSEPDGVAFHAASPKFVVTNDEDNGSMTRVDFLNDDYTLTPTISMFASGGFRGDLLQVGPDGCIYATQGRNALGTDPGTRYDDGTETTEDSLVRICGGFVPGPGVEETTTPPACTGSIGDFVWNDLDRDGIQDANELGIGNVTVTLKKAGAPVGTAVTDGSGFYHFTGNCAGDYTVEVTTPPGYAPTPSGQGLDFEVDSNPSPASLTLTGAAAVDHSIDFGYVKGAISGFTYADANNNGVFNLGEPAINNVLITLSGAATGTATTARAGAYAFNDLLGGVYSVSAPASAGTLTRTTPSPLAVTLAPGEVRPDVNFGYRETVKPSCVINNAAGTMTFQDPSGIVSLVITKNLNNNFRVTMPTLAPGPWPAGTTVTFNPASTQSLVVSAVRINTSTGAQLIVNATDIFGNVKTCDPVITEVTKLRHERGNQTFTDLPYEEHVVRIDNDNPGLRAMDIIVNGTTFQVRRLADNATRVVDVISAMRHGDHNTITLVPRGKKGDSATVTISDGSQ